MKKIGILGGTFNPIHTAHIMLAERAYDELQLDKVLIMPSNNPPHKNVSDNISDEDRLEMIKLAIEGHEHLELSDFEMQREGLTFTSDTLTALNNINRQNNEDIRYYFIVGGDSLFSFASWHLPDVILKNCALVAAGRNDINSVKTREQIEKIRTIFSKDNFIPEIYYLSVPSMDISSTQLKQLLSFNMSVKGILDDNVIKYINSHKLYQNAQYEAIKADLQGLLKPSRYNHDISVAQTAVKIAKNIDYPLDRAYLAGLLHDCAKYLNDEEILKCAEDNEIELTDTEKHSVQLVHAKVGAYFAETKYGIKDSDIIDAVKYHTTGKPDMTELQKIIYIADSVEPLRTWGEDDTELNLLRSVATSDIDKTMFLLLKHTYDYLLKTYKDNISQDTYETYIFYKNLYEKREDIK